MAALTRPFESTTRASVSHARHNRNASSRAAAPCGAARQRDDAGELALLAEFMRHDTVASLAGAIAERLGGKALDKDLIADADLGCGPRSGLTVALATLPPGN